MIERALAVVSLARVAVATVDRQLWRLGLHLERASRAAKARDLRRAQHDVRVTYFGARIEA